MSGPARKVRTKEKYDDLMPNRHGSRLQEVSGILILPPQDRHRRLRERRKITIERARGEEGVEDSEIDEAVRGQPLSLVAPLAASDYRFCGRMSTLPSVMLSTYRSRPSLTSSRRICR